MLEAFIMKLWESLPLYSVPLMTEFYEGGDAGELDNLDLGVLKIEDLIDEDLQKDVSKPDAIATLESFFSIINWPFKQFSLLSLVRTIFT